MQAAKIAAIGAGVLAFAVVGLVVAAGARADRVREAPMPDIKATDDPEMIARGEYLVWGPGHCAGCHGAIEQLEHYEETNEKVPLTGGFIMPVPPGKFVVPNITPDEETGIGKMSDGEIARALRYGVNRHGAMLFPVMPFQNVSDDDLTAIISYLRTLEPVKQARDPRELAVLGKILFGFVMDPVGPNGTPPKSVTPGPTAEYGEYLAKNVANCYGCHTNRDLATGEFTGEPMGGGLELPHRDKVFVVPNITVGGKGSRTESWDEAGFIARVREGKPSAPGSPMPWSPLNSMSDDDLKAIWAWLKTVEPVDRDTGPGIKAG